MKNPHDMFNNMISLEHLFQCWDEFKQGKKKREDIQFFERHIEDNIFRLHDDLEMKQYHHQPYEHFNVTDPKQRSISKATVRDRLVHHMLYNAFTTIFDSQFIHLSLASRKGKGIHFGIKYLGRFIRKISANGRKPCFGLKMDIKRFFDSVDHEILKKLIRGRVTDEKILHLTDIVIDSFTKTDGKKAGIPLGNVTSQLFANIYLHVLDDYIKQELREKYYLRYCDDFIVLSNDSNHLKSLIKPIQQFLKDELLLELHPNKISFRTLNQGIDFIGYVLFSKHVLLRLRTKKRMFKQVEKTFRAFLLNKTNISKLDQQLQSYLGILSHANEYTVSTVLKNAYWVRNDF